jgi:hypothetical protein
MPSSRLAKKSLLMMREATYKSKCLAEIQQIRLDYNIPDWVFQEEDWKTQIKQMMVQTEWQRWHHLAASKEALMFHTKNNEQGRERYLGDSRESRAMCQARLGDEYRLIGAAWPNCIGQCPTCNTQTSNIILHIIQQCQSVASLRTWNTNKEETKWMQCRRALNNHMPDHVRLVGSLITA